jgi:hypothetical protein
MTLAVCKKPPLMLRRPYLLAGVIMALAWAAAMIAAAADHNPQGDYDELHELATLGTLHFLLALVPTLLPAGLLAAWRAIRTAASRRADRRRTSAGSICPSGEEAAPATPEVGLWLPPSILPGLACILVFALIAGSRGGVLGVGVFLLVGGGLFAGAFLLALLWHSAARVLGWVRARG